MYFIGAHVSIAGGLYNAPINAHKIEATAFGMFTKNQRQWKAKPIKDAEKFSQTCQKYNYTPQQILPHDSYLINLGSPEKEKLEKVASFSTVSYLSVDFDYVCGLELIFPLWLIT